MPVETKFILLSMHVDAIKAARRFALAREATTQTSPEQERIGPEDQAYLLNSPVYPLLRKAGRLLRQVYTDAHLSVGKNSDGQIDVKLCWKFRTYKELNSNNPLYVFITEWDELSCQVARNVTGINGLRFNNRGIITPEGQLSLVEAIEDCIVREPLEGSTELKQTDPRVDPHRTLISF